MRKISAEMPSNPQQNHLGMESNASIAPDVATMTGAGCTVAAAGRVIGGCVFFVFTAGAGVGDGFGKACRTGEAATFGGNTGGRCDEMMGVPVLTGDVGVIVGADRRGGMAGVRDGRRIRAASCFAPSFWRPCVVSGLWGSAMRTVSFFGSSMTDHVAPRKIAENSFIVTR